MLTTHTECSHPAHRLYAWTAYDGVLVVCCCACGAVLQGAAPEPGTPEADASAARAAELQRRVFQC